MTDNFRAVSHSEKAEEEEVEDTALTFFVFVDNNGARFVSTKSYSPAPSVERVLNRIVFFQYSQPSFVWYGHVPSASILADAPSRGEVVGVVG